MSHTPTPWRVRYYALDGIDGAGRPNVLEGDIQEADTPHWYGRWIATFPELLPRASERQHADAEHIVRCVNAWDNADALRARLAELEGRK